MSSSPATRCCFSRSTTNRASSNGSSRARHFVARPSVQTAHSRGERHAGADRFQPADPPLKPALIDRFLVTAGKGNVRGLVCINKCDLVDPAELQPIVGLYTRLGYEFVPASTRSGLGIDRLRELLRGEATVISGQSGVGKSSLLNAIQPGLKLDIGGVSETSRKGTHTTRVARLLQLDVGGWVVDTPGIRQMELWDVHPGEVEAYFVEFRPFVPLCRFPNCLHIEEAGCAVKAAVRQDLISLTRYESYLRIVSGDD